MTQTLNAIETRNLSRRFGTRAVVQSVNLRVPLGSVYGFLGLNGAGKTTTIRLLLGLIKADDGAIEVFGEPLHRGSLGRIGSLVEVPSLYPHLTGWENLESARRQVGASRSQIDRVLAIVNLAGEASRLVREYSLGMKQRLGVALALLNSPQLLILDEPTNGLDPVGIQDMRELLRRLPREHGVTVFLSSHLLTEVEHVAGCVGVIDEGRLIFEGTLADLRRHRHERLRLGVRQPTQAVEFLRTVGCDAQQDGAEFVIVVGAALNATDITRGLVQHGHDVFHVSRQEESLEDLFLSLTHAVPS